MGGSTRTHTVHLPQVKKTVNVAGIQCSGKLSDVFVLLPGLPDECVPILESCLKNGHTGAMPDQLTVNQYQPGQGGT